jgi:glycosyltransferase involved in cell wall biosynthesis
MKKLVIAIKNKTNILNALKEFYQIIFYKEQTFFEKLLLKERQYPDIYFHQGVVNTEALDMVENSKLTIVNSRGIKEQLTDKRSYINEEKVEILYPYINTKIEYSKEFKKEFRKLHEIPKEERVILFSAKEIELGGIDKFLEIAQNLENQNFLLLFDINSKDQEKLQSKLQKVKLENKVLHLKQNYLSDELFVVSDIYLLTTQQKLFAPSVLKAMFLKNALFVMRDNMASEIVDSFSLILGIGDRSIYFKVDALLGNKKELKTIQKENYLVVKNMRYESYLKELKELISFHLIKESASTREF